MFERIILVQENEHGWKFHLKVCQITHKSIFARGHNLRKKNAEYSHQIRIFDIQESPGKYSNIRISVPALVSMSFRCLSVFGWMFEYLPRISLKHSNMILVRIPSPSAITLGESVEDTPPARQNIRLVSECVIESGVVPPQENTPEAENKSPDDEDDAPSDEQQPKLGCEGDIVDLYASTEEL